MRDSHLSVVDALKQRFSTRAYYDKKVNKELIEKILSAASQSPSGANLQPWQVIVTQGESKDSLSKQIIAAYENGEAPHPDQPYYPQQWYMPYKQRRYETGMALYSALKIDRKDTLRRQEQWKANYRFFGAPVGLLILVDSRLGNGVLVDIGIFLQSIMLAATQLGLSTCPQAAMGDYPDIVRKHFDLAEHMHIVCGVSLGYADESHPVNQYRTTRSTPDEFTRWFD